MIDGVFRHQDSNGGGLITDQSVMMIVAALKPRRAKNASSLG